MSEELDELKQIMTAVYSVLGSKKLAKVIAKCYRNIFRELVQEGFTDKEALMILTSMKLGNTK